MKATLRQAYRPLRRLAHEGVSAIRGGRGVRVMAAPDWPVSVSPAGYEDLRYWLRYEGPTFQALRRVWRAGMQVLDVGAHHGLFALCCCRPGALPRRVVAVEPSPQALPELRANRAVHREVNWRIVEAAAGDREGRLKLHSGFIHMLVADPTLHQRFGETMAPIQQVEVRVATLDAICAECEIEPDLIKLDVEGYEAEALRGAGRILKQGPIVMLEWHWTMLERRGLDAIAALSPLADAGYGFEPFEYPELGRLNGNQMANLPKRDIYRFTCRR